MEDPRNMRVEPAGRSEGDWSAAPLSSAGLPEYVEGEFDHMVERRWGEEEPLSEEELAASLEGELTTGEDDEALPLEVERLSEEEQKELLNWHMSALIEIGGKKTEAGSPPEENTGFRRLMRPFTRR